MTPRSTAVHRIREQLQIMIKDVEEEHAELLRRIRAVDQLLSLVDQTITCPLDEECPIMHGKKTGTKAPQ